VSTTARMSANLGYETFVVSDATATFDRKGVDGEIIPAEVMHKVALASLNEEFATILKAEQIINYEKTSV
jgi:nicotinamidase-related amidase